MLDAVLAGIVVLDAQGRVELLNAAACRLLEASPDAVRGAEIERVLGAEHPIARLARAALESGRSALANEQRLERRFEADLLVDAAASPLQTGSGQPDGAVLVLRDRTLQSRLQELVFQRESLASFGHIAAGIAHEVRNPLGGIRGAAELLSARAGDAKTRDAAELIARESERIATLVDDLMIFTRQDDVRFEPVNVHRVLDDVLDLLAMDRLAAKVEVKRLFDPSIPDLLADADRLIQVFLNLARNALQAMDGAGCLTIRTRMSVDQRLSGSDGRPVPTVLVELTDTGPGIPAEVLGRLGTPFFTTRSGGTGLGLAVAQQWIARHGGALHLQSTPGEGTSVQVALPLEGRP